MQKRGLFLILAAAIFLAGGSAYANDASIKKTIIAESLSNYPGPCPCPYNTMRNGRRCGGNSAYSKPGGHSPVCYETDVTPAMIRSYKARRP